MYLHAYSVKYHVLHILPFIISSTSQKVRIFSYADKPLQFEPITSIQLTQVDNKHSNNSLASSLTSKCIKSTGGSLFVQHMFVLRYRSELFAKHNPLPL